MPQRLATAARALTESGAQLCFEKTLDMPFLAYYGCSKLLKARAVFYWGTHTRFTVSVGIDPREVPIADCMCMDKRARISPLREIVYYLDTCIVYLAVRETEYFTEILRNIPRMREQWCPGPPPQKRPGNEAKSLCTGAVEVAPLLAYCIIANSYTLLRKISETSVKMKKDVGMTPCQKLLKQEGSARWIESMQQSSATPSLHLVFWGLRKIVACSQSSSSSLHPSTFLMIFTLVII